jgi:hypothetical protein
MEYTRRRCLKDKTPEERAACPKTCCVMLWKALIEETAKSLFYMEDTTGYTFWDGDKPMSKNQVYLTLSKVNADKFRDRARKIVRSRYEEKQE